MSSDESGAFSPADDCTLAATATAGQANCALTYRATGAPVGTLTNMVSDEGFAVGDISNEGTA